VNYPFNPKDLTSLGPPQLPDGFRESFWRSIRLLYCRLGLILIAYREKLFENLQN